jgi:hypothetical protein
MSLTCTLLSLSQARTGTMTAAGPANIGNIKLESPSGSSPSLPTTSRGAPAAADMRDANDFRLDSTGATLNDSRHDLSGVLPTDTSVPAAAASNASVRFAKPAPAAQPVVPAARTPGSSQRRRKFRDLSSDSAPTTMRGAKVKVHVVRSPNDIPASTKSPPSAKPSPWKGHAKSAVGRRL